VLITSLYLLYLAAKSVYKGLQMYGRNVRMCLSVLLTRSLMIRDMLSLDLEISAIVFLELV